MKVLLSYKEVYYMANIIRINMTNKTITVESVPHKYNMLGGRGLTSQIVMDEVDPSCNPLGQSNKLVIAPGLLVGTKVTTSGRLSIGSKSPLTGGIKESNAGGTAATKLAKLGIKAIILEGMPQDEAWNIIRISQEGVNIIPENSTIGLGNYDTGAYLKDIYGEKIGIMSIGQAGEMQMGAATIAVTDMDGRPCRHCGRGGLGAVMGSKKIKAIVIDDQGATGNLMKISDIDGFNEVANEWSKELIDTKKGMTKYGTAILVNPINALGGLPTRNFSLGSFDRAHNINGQALLDIINARGGKSTHACQPGCVIRCSNVFNDKEGNYVSASLEFETIALFGANLEIDSYDTIAICDKKCDDYGLDTMEMGNAIAVAMEGGIAEFGDHEAPKWLLDEVSKGTTLGRVLGQGATITGKVFGVTRVPAVKGQGMAAYDPRALKGTGVTYATSPMGADHTAGNILPGTPGVDPSTPQGQVEASRLKQIMASVIDSMGLCIFVGVTNGEMERVRVLLEKATGKELDIEEIMDMGRNVLNTELNFNMQAGFHKTDNRLPEFFKYEALPPNGNIYDVTDDDLDKVHTLYG